MFHKPLLQAYNKILKKIRKRPVQAVLEMTNRCNLNCPFCMVGNHNELIEKYGDASHDHMTRKLGVMSEETFNLVYRNLKSFGIKKVYMHFQGEPFLNKNTPAFSKRLKQAGISVGVFTNGLAFTDRSIDEIAGAGIDLIRFSIDGATQDTYEQNRVGGNLEKVMENMKKVASAVSGKTRVEWQLVALKNNEHEIDEARELAKTIGVNFFVKGFRETNPKLAPKNPEYRSKLLKKPCSDIFHQIGIYWNGDVVPCCYDVDGKEIMGNLHENDLSGIWNSDKYISFRKRVRNFSNSQDNEPAICRNCLRWK